MTNDYLNRFYKTFGLDTKCAPKDKNIPSNNFKPGDWVRIRPMHEIRRTLNHWNQVKGCAFMPIMAGYCGITARVYKVMRRFCDECDLRIKKSNGIILLEGITCEGTPDMGECDRSCFHFWREEWLEKIEPPPDAMFQPAASKSGSSGWVRVRTAAEIMASIQKSGAVEDYLLKPQMLQYCGTQQRIMKPMHRYLDEHDLTIKTARGIVLLDGVICQGGSADVNCDRSCHYMWREEWLEHQ